MRNGQSWFDPKRVKVRSYPVAVESGQELANELAKGPYVAETFPVHVEDSYVIVKLENGSLVLRKTRVISPPQIMTGARADVEAVDAGRG